MLKHYQKIWVMAKIVYSRGCRKNLKNIRNKLIDNTIEISYL